MQITMIDAVTLEIYDPHNMKTLFLADLLIDLLSIDTNEILKSINNNLNAEVKDKKSFYEITQSFGSFCRHLIGKSLDRGYTWKDGSHVKAIYNFRNGKSTRFSRDIMELFIKYIIDVMNPLFSLSKRIIMHHEPPEKMLRFQTQIRYSLVSDGMRINDIYDFDNFEDFIRFTVIKVYSARIVIKICANCGKLFIPTSRSDEIYCDRVVNQGTRTCKQVGYENKDEFIKAYRTAYKTKNALKNRSLNNNQHAKDDFKKWVYAAKIKLEESQSGIITFEEFKKWLKQ